MNLEEQLKVLNNNRIYYTDKEFNFLRDKICNRLYGETYREIKAAHDESKQRAERAAMILKKVKAGIELTKEDLKFLDRE